MTTRKIGSDFMGTLREAMSVVAGPRMSTVALRIVQHLRENGFTLEEQPDRQALALGEETGEFLQAYRQWRGMARRNDKTVEDVKSELADVIITAYVTAAERGWDIDRVIEEKTLDIFTRGWRDESK